MTVEEKAKQYAEEAIEALYSDSDPMQDFVQKLKKYAKVDFLAGYNEAMRWRDVEEELPEDRVLVQVKYRTLFIEKSVDYEHTVYYAVHETWDLEQYGRIKVTHWRPIE